MDSEARNRSENSALQAQVQRLQDQADVYKRKVELEDRRLDELDKQAKIMQVKVLEMQQQGGGKDANKVQDIKTY